MSYIRKASNLLSLGRSLRHLKNVLITSSHKKRDKQDPLNYRPISITSAASEVYETFLEMQMRQYLNPNVYISRSHFRSKKGIITKNALLWGTEISHKYVIGNNYISAAFLDLSKTFSISHKVLLAKLLNQFNFCDQSKSIIGDYLSHRLWKGNLNNNQTVYDWITLYWGVPQCTILGSLLFHLNRSSLHNVVQDAHIIQYADDALT